MWLERRRRNTERLVLTYIRVHFLNGGIGVFPMTAHVCPAGQSIARVEVDDISRRDGSWFGMMMVRALDWGE